MTTEIAAPKFGIGRALLAVLAAAAVGCGGHSPSGSGAAPFLSTAAPITTATQQAEPRTGTLTGLEIQPAGLITLDDSIGSAFQIIVDGHYRDQAGTFPRDLTREVTYTSDDPAVVTVGGDGLIQAVFAGTTRIEATINGPGGTFTAEATVEVVAAGARPGAFTRLVVLPPYRTLDRVNPLAGTEQLQQLVVVASDASGRKYDLTRSIGLSIQDDDGDPSMFASVTPTGLLRAVATGEVFTVARLSNQGFVSGAHFVLGNGVARPVDPNSLYSGAPLAGSNNPIDQAVLANLFGQLIEPAPLASDGEFARRLYADALGRVPTDAELIAFRGSSAADHRAAEVDRVLASPEFAARWGGLMGEWFVIERGQNGSDFDAWAEAAIAADRTLAEIVADLAAGNVASFDAQHDTAADKVDALIQASAGMSASCAKCHDHPLTGPSDTIKWTQAERYPLDAFFALNAGEATALNRDGVRTGPAYQPGFVFDPSQPVASTLADPIPQRRAEFAQLFTGSEAFRRGLAHRIFAEVSRPLLNPNQFLQRELDAVVVPNVLAALTRTFEAENTSLKGFLAQVFKSATYQLSTSAEDLDVANDPLFQRALPRRHQAEVMAAAVDQLTGAAATGGDRAFFHQVFGYPETRESLGERSDAVNMSQALVLQNSPVVQGRLTGAGNTVANLADAVAGGQLTEEEAVQQVFRLALSRDATADELTDCLDAIAQAADVREGLEDVAAAVVGTVEFVTK